MKNGDMKLDNKTLHEVIDLILDWELKIIASIQRGDYWNVELVPELNRLHLSYDLYMMLYIQLTEGMDIPSKYQKTGSHMEDFKNLIEGSKDLIEDEWMLNNRLDFLIRLIDTRRALNLNIAIRSSSLCFNCNDSGACPMPVTCGYERRSEKAGV